MPGGRRRREPVLHRGRSGCLTRTAQVLFVKDSSANKCGVICSSFEIAAGLLIDEADFEIKDEFVGKFSPG